MKFKNVCIAVKDINASKAFYQVLFNLEIVQDYGINVSFGTLALQQDFDWLLGIPKEQIKKESHNMELYFETDHFDAFIIKLEKYHNIQYVTTGVKETSWGQRSIHFYDLDRHIIEVGENLKHVVQRFLNSGMCIEETSKRMDISIQDLKTLLNS